MIDKNENIQYLVIDLFCGAGGTTLGFENAVDGEGRKIAKAIVGVNHDKNAIASHAANHPDTVHFQEDIRTLDLSKITEVIEVVKKIYPKAKVVVHASLECTNHSNAKGGLPRDRDSRMLAYELNPYVEVIQPDFITIENVREFMAWGEIDDKGKPISRDKGKYFQDWTMGLCREFGYNVEWKLLNAADYGAYTSRKRLFMVFARPNLIIKFPIATHSKKPSGGLFGAKLKPWKAVKEVLDLHNEGKSIFGRKKPYAESTQKRILAGLVKFVANGDKNWMIKYLSNNAKSGINNGASLNNPSPTVTCQNRLALASVQFLQSNYSGKDEYKVQTTSKPAPVITTEPKHKVVNVKFIQKNYSGAPNDKVQSVEQPAPTITTIPHESLVNVNFLAKYYGNGNNISSPNEPCGTLTTKDRISTVTAKKWIDKHYSGPQNHSSIEQPAGALTTVNKQALVTANQQFLFNPQFGNKGNSINKPAPTLIARMDKRPISFVTCKSGQFNIPIYEIDSETTINIKVFMAAYNICDIRMRMLNVTELKRIQGFPEDYILKGNQAEQKKFIGNSVEGTMGKVLLEALYQANKN